MLRLRVNVDALRCLVIRFPCCRLAEHHGANTLRRSLLDGESIDLEAARGAGLLDRFPTLGRLDVEFRSQQRPPEHCAALTSAQFDAAWTGCCLSFHFLQPATVICNSENMLHTVEDCCCRLVSEGAGSAHRVADGWKVGLLDILCLDFYFTVKQVIQVRPPSNCRPSNLRLICAYRTDQVCACTVLTRLAATSVERSV